MPQNWDTSFTCSGCLQASRGSHVYWFDVWWGKGPLRLTRLIEDLSALLDIASQGQGPRVLWRNAAVTLTRPYVSIFFQNPIDLYQLWLPLQEVCYAIFAPPGPDL